MKIIVTIIPLNSFTNSFLCFSSFRRNERQEPNFWQVSGLVTRNISVLFKRNRALLQSYAEFKRILKKDCTTCYSCSYYSSMI